MSSWVLVLLQLRALELKLGVERGGFRFWLFVFNCLVSLCLLVVLAFLVHGLLAVFAVGCVLLIIKYVDVTGFWNRVTK